MSEQPSEKNAHKKKKESLSERLGRIGKVVAVVAGIFTGISTVAGLTWNVYEDAKSTRERREAQRVSQLTTYGDFGEVIKHYRSTGRQTAEFVRKHWKYNWNCDSLLDIYTTGAGIYYAEDLQTWAEVREFYEDLGILVRYGAIEFDLVFEAIIFPSDLVEQTDVLSDCVCENWYGRGKRVAGFSFNLKQLQENYQRKRNGEPVQWTSYE